MRIHYIRRIRINPKQVKYFKTVEKKNDSESGTGRGTFNIIHEENERRENPVLLTFLRVFFWSNSCFVHKSGTSEQCGSNSLFSFVICEGGNKNKENISLIRILSNLWRVFILWRPLRHAARASLATGRHRSPGSGECGILFLWPDLSPLCKQQTQLIAPEFRFNY